MNDSCKHRPWRAFRAHFEANAARPLPAIIVEGPGDRPTHLRPPDLAQLALAAVLARFQLGEAGEGRVAREIDRLHLPEIDDDYRQSLKLFVKEEARHARLLGQMVTALGGQLLRAGTSNWLFRRARRLLGLRFKVVVLLVAEVVGGEIYRLLETRAGDAGMRAALRQIAADERAHLQFHVAFLASRPRRWPLRAGFWVVGLAATAVVATENRRDLRRLGISVPDIVARLAVGLWETDRLAFAGPQVVPVFAGAPGESS